MVEKCGSMRKQGKQKAGRPRLSDLSILGPAWIVFFVLAIAAWASIGDQPQTYLPQGWSASQARTIVQNKTSGLMHAAALAFVFAMTLQVLYRIGWRLQRKTVLTLVWVLVLVVAADSLWLSQRYVKTVSDSWLEKNAVFEFLQQEAPDQRVKLMGKDAFYTEWQTYHMPFYGIEVFANQPTYLSEEYYRLREVLNKCGRFDRFGQLCAVKMMLGPNAFYDRIQEMPEMHDVFKPVFTYNVMKRPEGSVQVIPATETQPGTHMVLRADYPAPRYALVANWAVADDEMALQRMGEKDYVPFEQVLIAPEHGGAIPGMTGHGIVGKVEVIERQPGKAVLRTASPQPAILRIADQYDPNWHAVLDGEPVEVLRCDYLFHGIVVPKGEHTIEVIFSKDDWTLWVQYSGMALCAAALAYLVLLRCRA